MNYSDISITSQCPDSSSPVRQWNQSLKLFGAVVETSFGPYLAHEAPVLLAAPGSVLL